LVDVFGSNDEKTDPIVASGREPVTPRGDGGTDTGDGFTRLPTETQYSGDLPRLFRFGNRYQVLEKLGEGGMGRVYKALDLELDRPVALKTIRAEKGRAPEVLKRFKQELILARKITHKNVVRIYDLGEAEGVKFFTMELIEGRSLRDLLREKKVIPVKEAISFMKQSLSGLAEAHSQGVVHRDLKPQNLMIDGSGLLRIMDFGIARTADTATLTGSGEMMGTPDYISPEQVKGETTTAQSDLYSVGIILYELLTGDVPFKGDTAISKVVARLQVKPVSPRTLNPEIPAYLECIVLKLMEVDPDLRYETADEVLQDLEREQVDSSYLLRTRKAVLRRKGWIAAVLAASVGLGAWVLQRSPSGEVHADVPVTTIAILPFHNMTGNPELEWMENGIQEMLITDISQSSTLRPLLEDRIRQILRDLGKSGQTTFDEETLEVLSNMAAADYVLHGRFVESQHHLRVDVVLKERRTGVGIPIKFDGKSGEVFALVDSVTDRITTELDLDTIFDGNRPIAEVATSSLEAFRSYQRGIGDLHGGRNQAAATGLKEAIRRDPDFAMAHARLAEALWNLEDLEAAQSAIQKAETLALEHPLPHSERFQIHAISARIQNDPDTAAEAYRRLADFFPSDPNVMLGWAAALESKGEMTQALETYQAVLEANPTYGAALLGLGRMLDTLDRSSEAIPFLERAVASGDFRGDPESLGMLHSILGAAYRNTGDSQMALKHFQTSLSSRREANDPRGIAATLVNMAITHRRLKQYEKASALLSEAVDAARRSRNRSTESFALLNLGNVAKELNRLDDALEYYRSSLDIEFDLNQQNEIAYRLDSLAEIYWRKGQFVDALVYLRESDARIEGIGESSEAAFHLGVLGQVQKARGQYEEAIQAFLKAIPALEQTRSLKDLASSRCALAEIYVVQGRFREALQVIQAGLRYFEKDPGVNLATLKLCHADFLIQVGDYPEAQEQLDFVENMDLADELDSPGLVEYLRGRLLAATERPEAEKHLWAAVEEASKSNDLLLSSRVNIALGRAMVSQGMLERGTKVVRTSLEQARRTGHRSVQASAALALAEIELISGRRSAAEELLGEAKLLADGFQGRLLLRRINQELSSLARHRGDLAVAEKAKEEAGKLTAWLLDNLPSQHTATFQSLNHGL
jgi:serine/threonine protein kinase/Tfp pilus assembly protein PilF